MQLNDSTLVLTVMKRSHTFYPSAFMTRRNTCNASSKWGDKANVCCLSTCISLLAIFNPIKTSTQPFEWMQGRDLRRCETKELNLHTSAVIKLTNQFEWPCSYVILDIWCERAGCFFFISSCGGGGGREGGRRAPERSECVCRCCELILEKYIFTQPTLQIISVVTNASTHCVYIESVQLHLLKVQYLHELIFIHKLV